MMNEVNKAATQLIIQKLSEYMFRDSTLLNYLKPNDLDKAKSHAVALVEELNNILLVKGREYPGTGEKLAEAFDLARQASLILKELTEKNDE